MFTSLKEYINKINRSVQYMSPENLCEMDIYLNVVNEIIDNGIMQDIIMDIRRAIADGMLLPYSKLERYHSVYYVFKVGVDRFHPNIPNGAGVVYQDDGNNDTIWLFGFPMDVVLKIEYAYHSSDIHEYICTDVVDKQPRGFTAMLQMLFNGFDTIL